MTTTQLHWFNLLYFGLFILFAFVTRATRRRIVGAVAGTLAAGISAIGLIAAGERAGVWHFTIRWEPYFLILLVIDFALGAFAVLIVWRVVRRFGTKGFLSTLAVAAVFGPPRDYAYMRRFPEWGAYAPGLAPVFAISATYVLLAAIGYGVMRLVAGPADADELARSPQRYRIRQRRARRSDAHDPPGVAGTTSAVHRRT